MRQGQLTKLSTGIQIYSVRYINCYTRLDVGLRDDPGNERDRIPAFIEHKETQNCQEHSEQKEQEGPGKKRTG